MADVARICTEASQQTWPSVSAITNAAFHAGVAERLLGENPSAGATAAETSGHFDNAAELLLRAISLAPERTSGSRRPPAKPDAMLELARVRYDQARYPAALAQIDELLRLENNSESAVHASAHYWRGLTLDASGEHMAALSDWNTLVDDGWDDHPDAQAARTKIISVATGLGLDALERGTRADAQSAIDLFTQAQSAAEASNWDFSWPIAVSGGRTVNQAGIFINRGRARLDLAGLSGRAGFVDFSCAPDSAQADLLTQARADFVSATGKDQNSDRAWRHLSCTQLALGETDQAIQSADTATRHAPASGAERSEDFRMLGRARAVLQTPTGAAEAFEEAQRNAPTAQMRARILLELALVYERTNQAELARARLLDAVGGQGDRNYAPAFVELGKNYFAPDAEQHDYFNARAHLSRAEELTNPRYTMHDPASNHERDRTVRAEALYYLSRLNIEWPGHYNGQAAINYADEAFQLDGSTDHRNQACLARVRAGNVATTSQAQGYCAAVGQTAPTSDSYLLEGVYSLRRAQFLRGGDVHRALEAAYRAFTEGLRVLPSDATPLLHAKLLQGQATAQFCVGFAQVGHDLEASIARTIGGPEAEAAAEAAHKFFDDYRVMTCDGSEHRH